jgi:RNA polymerase sigma-70 factor (ECF subfamily)
MATTPAIEVANFSSLKDEEVVERVLRGETALFEILMRRYNQRLYRAARAILRDDHEAEDVMQDAYVRAYQHLGQFEGRSQFSTWLTRIAVHEALARVGRRRRFQELDPATAPDGDVMNYFRSSERDPEQQASNSELHELLETAVGRLPQTYRSVFMLRDVEQMSTEEVARALDLTEATVKVRLHRARGMLRRELYARVGDQVGTVFPFHAVRCDRVVARVFERIAEQERSAPVNA